MAAEFGEGERILIGSFTVSRQVLEREEFSRFSFFLFFDLFLFSEFIYFFKENLHLVRLLRFYARQLSGSHVNTPHPESMRQDSLVSSPTIFIIRILKSPRFELSMVSNKITVEALGFFFFYSLRYPT